MRGGKPREVGEPASVDCETVQLDFFARYRGVDSGESRLGPIFERHKEDRFATAMLRNSEKGR